MMIVDIAVREQSIAKQTADYLISAYPNHAWAVNADIENGLVNVYNLSLSGKWGFRLRMDCYSASEFKKRIIRAGGEILERYNLSRGAADQAAISALNEDFAGNILFEK